MKKLILWLLLTATAFAQIPEPPLPSPSMGNAVLDGPPLQDQSYAIIVEMALQRNLRLLAGELEIPIAQAQYQTAIAARNPTLTNNFSYLHTDQDLTTHDLPNTRFLSIAAGTTLAQSTLYTIGPDEMLNRTTLYIPVYSGGRQESAMHLQKALLEVAKLGFERVRERIAYEAKVQYLATLLTLDNIQVAQTVRKQADEILTFAQARLNGGVGTKLDVLQAQLAVANAKDAEVKSATSADKAATDLAGIVDQPLLTQFTFKEHLRDAILLDNEKLPSRELKELARLALLQRPELGQWRTRMIANHERQNLAISATLPKLDININNDLTGPPSRLGDGESLIVVLTLPIYDAGLTHYRLEELRINHLQLQAQEVQQMNDIVAEVRRGLLDVTETDERLETARSARNKAREALRIATLRYQVGAGTSLELVTAQTVLANAEFALASAHYRQVTARAALNFALGQKIPAATGPASSGMETHP